MKFKALHAAAIKGATFSHKLAPFTLFYGQNFTNKSTRLEAFTLALAGYLPGVAVKPNELYDLLASSNPMTVQVDTDSEIFTRIYSQQNNGAVRYSGNDNVFPPVALDASKFLSLSGPAQTRFLFSCAKLPPESTTFRVAQTVTALIKNIRLEENTAASEQAVSELVDHVAEFNTALPVQDWLAEVAENMRVQKNNAVEAVRRMEHTNQGLTQVATERKVAPPDTMQRLVDAQKAKLDADTLVTKLQTQREGLAERWRTRNAQAKAGLPADQAKQLTDEKALLVQLIKTSQEVVKKQDEESIIEKVNTLSDKLGKAGAAVFLVDERLKVALALVDSLKQQIAVTKKAKSCEHCGQPFTAAWRKKAVTKLNKDLEQAAKGVVALQAKQAGAKQLAQEAALAHDAAKAKADQFEEVVRDELSARMRLSDIEELLATHSASLGAAEEAAQLLVDGTKAATDLKAALEQQTSATSALTAATADYDLLLQQRAESASKAAASAYASKTRAEVEVLKLACAKVADLQAELVYASVGPLVKTMNDLCGGILPHPLGFKDGLLSSVDVNKDVCYSHRTMSGTQKLLAYAALSVALASQAPAKVVILDELGRLHPELKTKLYWHLIALLQAGTIDQVLAVDVTAPGIDETEWFTAYEV